MVMKEINIKHSLVQVLAGQGSVEAIASEFPFQYGQRRADLVCLKDGSLYGYEIKSAFDRLDNLSSQMQSYCLLFDYVYTVCDFKHLESVRRIIPRKVGIYVCASDGLRLIRKATQIKRFDSVVMLDVMPVQLLQSRFEMRSRSKHQLCTDISKRHSLLSIREALISYIKSKYGVQTYFFKKEISSVVTLDDVQLLFLPSVKALNV